MRGNHVVDKFADLFEGGRVVLFENGVDRRRTWCGWGKGAVWVGAESAGVDAVVAKEVAGRAVG